MIHGQRTLEMEGIGRVVITRKSGVKRMSMRIHQNGELRVTIPNFVTIKAAEHFVISHKNWIKKQQNRQTEFKITDAMLIGKLHTIKISYAEKEQIRVARNVIDIQLQYSSAYNNEPQKNTIKKAIKRSLQKEAQLLLPSRVAELSHQYSLTYEDVKTKPMRMRWGSCSNKGIITLNCYIMFLPWEVIDYIIVHELAHTKHMNHSINFWNEVKRCSPDYMDRRKTLKKLQPTVHSFYV